jgi:hypothetical protein
MNERVEPMNERAEQRLGGTRIRIGAVIAVAAVIALIAWLIFKGDDNGDNGSARAPAVAASVQTLRSLPDTLGHAVYWAGTRGGGYTYELTQTKDGDVYIRYLPQGVQVGDDRPNFLTVGTYPHTNAFDTVTKASKRKGEFVARIPRGGLAVSGQQRQTSVYFAYPDSNYLIEVFDPSPARARNLVVSGRIHPIR